MDLNVALLLLITCREQHVSEDQGASQAVKGMSFCESPEVAFHILFFATELLLSLCLCFLLHKIRTIIISPGLLICLMGR